MVVQVIPGERSSKSGRRTWPILPVTHENGLRAGAVCRGALGTDLDPMAHAAALSVSVASQGHAWTWNPDLAIPTQPDTDEPGQDRRLGYPQWMPDAAHEKAISTASNRLIKRHYRLI